MKIIPLISTTFEDKIRTFRVSLKTTTTQIISSSTIDLISLGTPNFEDHPRTRFSG